MSGRIQVLKPGVQSQLQDLGRFGFQDLGVPVCGAMDEWAHRLANLLAGNAQDEATLEIVLMGPSLVFENATQIAITGADLSPRLNGEPVVMHQRIDIAAGSQLEFGRRVNGLRAYLAVRGGFAVDPVMGSRSTYVRGGFGGFQGRALRKGDVLPIPDAAVPFEPAASLPAGLQAGCEMPSVEPGAVTTVRVTTGEHWSRFTPEAQAEFAAAVYKISPQSDRMGYRLEGPALQRADSVELISEAMSFGTIQVPADGLPIVLMAERHSAGGYLKIAHVISVDLSLMAQLAPQQALRFERVSLEKAQTLYLKREQRLAQLRAILGVTV
jgi:antagonist of KipI